MLKFENLATVGQTIRAYDFYGNKEAYVEGKVIAKGEITHPATGMYMYEAYTIIAETDGAGFGREGEEMYIPFETSLEYDGRVEVL